MTAGGRGKRSISLGGGVWYSLFMIKLNQNGAVGGLMISFVLTVLLLLGALGFGFWAFMSRQDYKDNVDSKISAAVGAAKKEEAKKKDAEFVEAEKKPLRTYNGPEAYGSMALQYPKTWSGYVNETGQGSGTFLDGYFYPGIVPAANNKSNSFALRIQVLGQSYDSVVKTYAKDSSDAPTVAAYSLPGLPDVVGVRVTGKLTRELDGDMVILPLRSQTLKIWTEGSEFADDFETLILPNFTFSP